MSSFVFKKYIASLEVLAAPGPEITGLSTSLFVVTKTSYQ